MSPREEPAAPPVAGGSDVPDRLTVGQWVERLSGIGETRFGIVIGRLPDGRLLVEVAGGHRTVEHPRSVRPA